MNFLLTRLSLYPQLFHFLLHSFHVLVAEHFPRLRHRYSILLQHAQLLLGQQLVLILKDEFLPNVFACF